MYLVSIQGGREDNPCSTNGVETTCMNTMLGAARDLAEGAATAPAVGHQSGGDPGSLPLYGR